MLLHIFNREVRKMIQHVMHFLYTLYPFNTIFNHGLRLKIFGWFNKNYLPQEFGLICKVLHFVSFLSDQCTIHFRYSILKDNKLVFPLSLKSAIESALVCLTSLQINNEIGKLPLLLVRYKIAWTTEKHSISYYKKSIYNNLFFVDNIREFL